jgi:hypothetical protein
MALPREPQRRPEPKRFLDASLVPFERALLARAAEIEKRAEGEHKAVQALSGFVALQFRALAEELRYW